MLLLDTYVIILNYCIYLCSSRIHTDTVYRYSSEFVQVSMCHKIRVPLYLYGFISRFKIIFNRELYINNYTEKNKIKKYSKE